MVNIQQLLSFCIGVLLVAGEHVNGLHLSPKIDWKPAKRVGNLFLSHANGFPMMRRRSLMSPDEHHPPLKRFVQIIAPSLKRYNPGYPMMKKWEDLEDQIDSEGLAPPEFDYFLTS